MTTKETVGNAIYWVGGSTGGVGKSMVTMAILDHLMEMSATALTNATHRIRTCGKPT